MIKKRLAAIALSIVLAVGLMPAVALAADGGELTTGNALTAQDVTSYDLWVGGVEVTSANATNVTGEGISGKVSYDAATDTLTLNNATITKSDEYRDCIRHHADGDFTLKLVGTNKITHDKPNLEAEEDYLYSEGIMTYDTLIITGSGSLSVENDIYYNNKGIECWGLIVDANATVNVASTAGWWYDSYGIDANNRSVTVKGTLNTSAYANTQRACALAATDNVTVAKGGKLTAKASHGNYGMDAVIVRNSGTLTVNGSVTATSGECAITCGTVEVGSTGELDATGGSRAFSPSTKVKLGSSKLKVMSWSNEISASKIDAQQNIHIYMPKDAQKKANPITAKAKKVTFKASKVKKKAQSVKASKAFTVKKAQGKVTYKKTSGSKKITVSKAGKVTVKKGTKKGTYKAKVKVTAAGNATYKSGSKTVTLKVKVK